MLSSWIHPTKINDSLSSKDILTQEQIESWREKGFAVVEGLLSNEFVNKVYDEAKRLETLTDNCAFGSNGLLEFPCGLEYCDQVTLHPNILSAAAQLLEIEVSDLRLIQSDIWLKRGKEVQSEDQKLNNNSQRVHCGKIISCLITIKIYCF